MDEDELRSHQRLLEPRVLDSDGIDELHTYIAALRAEIARAEAMIARKSDHRGAAEAVFAQRG
jgi:uncharacterized small protein (DUF1192 family)